MNLLYVANIRMPTERAHGVQIMKACEAFARAGHTLELLVPRRWSPITEDPFVYYGAQPLFTLRFLGVRDLVQKWGYIGYFLQSLLFVCAAILYTSKHKVGVIYSRDEHVLVLFALCGFRNLVWESHDGAWNLIARFVARRAREMVVVTEGARQKYIQRGVPVKKILAVANGIDIEAFKEPVDDARVRLGLPEGPIVMYVGSLDGWKGTDTLLDAAALVPDARIVVIGGHEKQLPALRAKYPRVVFVGLRPYRELPSNLAAADVCVLPNTAHDAVSVSFTSPLKLLAYMAAGKPIVASDLPSVREIAGNAVLYTRPDDPKALAKGIQTLLDDRESAAALGAAAREQVRAFSWDARAQAILAFIG